jgi:glucose/arabinose dehydrogenase
MSCIKYIFFLFCLLPFLTFSTLLNTSNYKKYNYSNLLFKLEKLDVNFEYPWALSFVNDDELIVTEKGGGLFLYNLVNHSKKKIKHNIPHIKYDPGGQQGGLLDIYYNPNDDFFYFSYSHDFDGKYSSTAIARSKLVNDEIVDFQDLLIAQPKLKENRHYGSRIVIKDNELYAGFGERGGEMIAQNPQAHPGSIVRILTDGQIPKDNPHFTTHPNWLPEIYVIGVRNPQGIALTPNKEVLFSNHGPRGGDHIAIARPGSNYGWKHIAWGGTEYTGISIGKSAFDSQFTLPELSWVPSIAVSSIQFYEGKVFPELKGDLIVCSLNGEALIRIDYENDAIVGEEIIFKSEIGRIRDFDIDKDGNIYLISDARKSAIWKLTR